MESRGLAAAHLDTWARSCQRCPHHLAQCWIITAGARQSAISSHHLFFGTYPALIPALASDFATQLRAVETRVDGYIAALEDAQGNGASASVLENLLASPLLFHAGA